MPEQIPVHELIDQFLQIVPEKEEKFRYALRDMKNGIFLELPETRARLLIQLGKEINNHVPGPGVPTDEIPVFWFKLRDIMLEQFELMKG